MSLRCGVCDCEIFSNSYGSQCCCNGGVLWTSEPAPQRVLGDSQPVIPWPVRLLRFLAVCVLAGVAMGAGLLLISALSLLLLKMMVNG